MAVFVGLAAALLFLIVFFTRSLPSIWGRPYGMRASSDGFWFYPKVGRKRFFRWEEIRLFEVDPTADKSFVTYRVYGRGAIAHWLKQPPSSFVTLDLTRQEFEQRHQALLNLIAARTHLLPRTLHQRLKIGWRG